jgi:hypothetical protein
MGKQIKTSFFSKNTIFEGAVKNIEEIKGVQQGYEDYSRSIILDSIGFDLFDKRDISINNLYPQYVAFVVNSSLTGATCLQVKKDFIFGQGINIDGKKIRINKEDSLSELTRKITNDLSFLHRFAVKLVYQKTPNGDLKVSKAIHIPIEWVRYCIPDEQGLVNKVVVNPYFNTPDEFSRGVCQRKEYFLFSDDEKLRKSQYSAHIKNKDKTPYTEIYFWNETNELDRIYSKPIYFKAGENAFLAESGIYSFHERNIANNFFLGGILSVKGDPNQAIPLSDNRYTTLGDEFESGLQSAFGGEKSAGSIMTHWYQSEENPITLTSFQANSNDKMFDSLITALKSNIASVMQVSPLLAGIEISGKLGDSQEKEGAIKFQNEKTSYLREKLSDFLTTLMSNFIDFDLAVATDGENEVKVVPISEYLVIPDNYWDMLPILEKQRIVKEKFGIDFSNLGEINKVNQNDNAQ